jgi:inorganic pyrophosphatase
MLTCYIEMMQTDTVRCELDKLTGLLTVDRPRKYLNEPLPPDSADALRRARRGLLQREQ